MTLLVATTNAGKAREFREILSADSLQWFDIAPGASLPGVEETGSTFLDNAKLKAAAFAKHFGRWALADDSGLEVDALKGSPGIFSARWAERHDSGRGDADNNRLLLEQLESTPDDSRTARFICALALANPAGEIILDAHGTFEGQILRVPRGTNGFGYDPLFEVALLGKTSAELSPKEKHAISHRGNALRAMRTAMAKQGLM